MNPYTGKTPIIIEGMELTLVFDWEALACIKAELGAKGQALAMSGDLEALATIVSIGLKVNHPEFTKDKVWNASPAVYPTIKAVESALVAAYCGPDGLSEETSENPQQPPETKSNWLSRRLSGQG